MSLKTKLLVALGVSLSLMAAICFILWSGRRENGMSADGDRDASTASTPAKAADLAKKENSGERATKPAGAVVERTEGPHAVFGPDEVWLITGRIVKADASGEIWPVEGAKVFLGPHPRRTKVEEAPPPQTQTTGADGKFELVGCPGRLWMRLDVDEPESAFRAFSFQLGDPDASGRRDLGDIPLEPALTLRVELVGPGGEAVEKGRVLVGRDDSVKGLALERMQVRDSRREARELGDGKYVLERTGAGEHSLKVLAPGHAGAKETVQMPREEPVVIRLAEGRRLAGKVLISEGKPFSGAIVEVDSGPNLLEPDPTTPTDSGGAFSFDFLSDGEYDVSVKAEGFATQKARRVPSGTETLEFTLEPEAVFAGKVVTEEDSRPIARATVTLHSATGSSYSADSSPDGTFSIRKVPGGSYSLVATHRDFARFTEAAREVKSGEKVEGLVLKLPAGLRVTGIVSDKSTQQPIAEAQVLLDYSGPIDSGDNAEASFAGAGFRRTGKTDEKGNFELKGLGDGRYKLSARATGYISEKSQKIEITSSGSRELTVELSLGGAIAGKVTDSKGKPVAGASVRPVVSLRSPDEWNGPLASVFNLTATTDAEGKYKLVGLPAYKGYTVAAQHKSHPEGKLKGITVELGDTVEDIDISLPPSSSIQGKVTDSSGAGIAGASVQASEDRSEPDDEDRFAGGWNGNNSRVKSATTDAGGAYTIDALRAANYTVSARAKDRMSATKTGIKVEETQPATGVDLVLGAGETLKGRVTDLTGTPIQGASVNVSTQESAQTQTDADGRFEVKGLTRGEASVSVSKQGFVNSQMSVQVPSGRELVLKLDRTAKILGVLRAEGVTTFRNYQVYARQSLPGTDANGARGGGGNEAYSNRGDPDGSFEIDVKPGTHVVHAWAQGFAPAESQPISVKAGDRVDGVVIDLTRGGTIEGVVIATATGTPIEGASVYAASNDPQVQQSFRFGMPNESTDAEGRFKLQGLPAATLSVTATHKDYAQATVQGVSVRLGQTATTRLEMSAGGGIRGVVRKGGAPLPNLRVFASSITPGTSAYKEVNTDAEGRYELKSLPAGDYNVQAMNRSSGASQIQGRVTVFDGQVSELDLIQEIGIVVSGRVLLGGVPVRGGRIEAARKASPAGGPNTRIADDGSYSLEVPSPGAYVLMVRVGNQGRENRARSDLVVPEGAADLRQDIDLPAGEISGFVVDGASGAPVEGAQVIVVPDGTTARSFSGLLEGFRGMDRTDAQGRFVVSALEAGLYSLRISRSGYAAARLDRIRVDARRGAAESRIALEAAITFRARVVDAGGRPVAGAVILLRDEGGELSLLEGPNRTDDGGLVSVGGVRPAVYEICAVHPSFAISRMTVEARDGGEVALQLWPGARLQIMVVNRQGKPIQGAGVDLLDGSGSNVSDDLAFASMMGVGATSATKADGTLAFEQVLPGKYRISAHTDSARSREERITIEEGKASEVRLIISD